MKEFIVFSLRIQSIYIKFARSCPKLANVVRIRPEMSEFAQSCPNLPKVVRICPKLSEFVQSCPNLPKVVRICPEMSEIVHPFSFSHRHLTHLTLAAVLRIFSQCVKCFYARPNKNFIYICTLQFNILPDFSAIAFQC